MWWLALIVLATAQDFDELDKRTKMLGCVEATRLKLAEDEQLIDQILETSIYDHGKVIDKIAADMLLNCYQNIDLVTAKEILKDQSFVLTDGLRAILNFDGSSFRSEDDIELSKEQGDLIAQIDNVFKEVEKKDQQEAEPVKYGSFSNFDSFKLGSWYLFVVFGLFFGLVLLGAKSLLGEKHKDKKKVKANKTK